jgi:copper(I)-binding protein
VTSPDAGSVRVHHTERDGGLLVMRPVDGLLIPPGTPLRMEPGGTHLMLERLARTLRPGDTVEVRLQFRLNGARTLRLPVRAYADVAAP